MFKKYTAIILMFVFGVWILPLGAFIKPAQEKKMCGGQRAICLCAHAKAMLAKVKLQKTISNAQEEVSSQVSSNSDFVIARAVSDINRSSSPNNFYSTFSYGYFVTKRIDHVPRFFV